MKKYKNFLLILVGLLFVCTQCCEAADDSLHYTLDNGLEVYVKRDARLAIASHVLLYKVGSANDPKGKSGLAHYLEHLMFRHSKKFENIMSELHRLNASYNASTSDYRTVYHATVHKKRLEDLIILEADRMSNLVIDEEAATLEQKIVLEERKMRLDSIPVMQFMEELWAAFFRNDSSWNTIGWEHEILSLGKLDAQRFYKSYYRPSNAVLIISGDVDLEKVKKLIDKHYAPIRNPSARVVSYPEMWLQPLNEPKHKAEIMLKMVNKVNSDRGLFYLFQAPNILSEDHAAFMVAAQILGGGVASVLETELVHNLRCAASVSVDYHYMVKGSGLMTVEIVPINETVSLDVLRGNVESVLSDLLKRGVENEDLEIAKMSIRRTIMMSEDGIHRKNLRLARVLSVGAKANYFEKLEKEIASVTPESINTAINEISASTKVIGFLDR